MLRKIGIFSLLMILMFFTGCNKKSVQSPLPLSDQEIEEAINYGIKNAELSTTEFVADWSVNLGYGDGKGTATLITPFLRTALLSRQAELMKQKVKKEIIEKALQEDADMLVFDILLFGNYPQFGRSVKALLKCNGKEVLPVYLFLPPYAEIGRDYIQSVKGTIKFKKTDIPKDTKKLVLWIQFDVDEGSKEKYTCEFDFDLSKYR